MRPSAFRQHTSQRRTSHLRSRSQLWPPPRKQPERFHLQCSRSHWVSGAAVPSRPGGRPPPPPRSGPSCARLARPPPSRVAKTGFGKINSWAVAGFSPRSCSLVCAADGVGGTERQAKAQRGRSLLPRPSVNSFGRNVDGPRPTSSSAGVPKTRRRALGLFSSGRVGAREAAFLRCRYLSSDLRERRVCNFTRR